MDDSKVAIGYHSIPSIPSHTNPSDRPVATTTTTVVLLRMFTEV